MELEAQIYITLHNPAPAAFRPGQVRAAKTMRRSMNRRPGFRRADHLVAAPAAAPAERRLSRDWAGLVQRLREDGQQLIAVDLSDGAPLRTPTVKAFIPGLVPIKFGAGNEPAGHPSINACASLRGTGRSPGFPHPFN